MIKVWYDFFGGGIYALMVICIPFLFYFLCKHFKFFNFLGVTICCFLTGMLVGNLIPRSWIDEKTVNSVRDVIVPLGIILMLFGTDLRKWIRVSFKVLLGYLLSLVGVVGLAILMFFILGKGNDMPYAAGMLTATYVGGTPNMAAVQLAYDIPDKFYNQLFLSDVLASSLYLLFVMVLGQRMIGFILKKYQPLKGVGGEEEVTADFDDERTLTRPLLKMLEGLGFAILVFAVPVIGWIIVYGNMKNISMVFVILSITVLAVLMSFSPRIRNNAWNFKTGDFLFSLFFTLLGTLAYFGDFYNINPVYLLFTCVICFGSVIVHVILCKIFGIDRDTMIITSAAGIMSPPFIPAIANAIKNKDLLVPGIAVGIIGLAAGNVLGIFVVKFLQGFQ